MLHKYLSVLKSGSLTGNSLQKFAKKLAYFVAVIILHVDFIERFNLNTESRAGIKRRNNFLCIFHAYVFQISKATKHHIQCDNANFMYLSVN